jgi:GNAT superfamily N-acetyltransferase
MRSFVDITVFVAPDHRGRGVSRLLADAILAHPDLKDVRLFRPATTDAHGLYGKYGFKSMVNPERAMKLFVDAVE